MTSSLAWSYSGLHWFRILNQPYIAGINPTCPWCITVFICAGLNLLIVCWELLHVYSCGILLCSFLFLYCLWLVLVSGWCWPHKLSWEGVHIPFSRRAWCYGVGVSTHIIWNSSVGRLASPPFVYLSNHLFVSV